MTKWEYARLESRDAGINVVFTHHGAWSGLAPEAFFDTLRRLGDEGWELVAALPLTASVTPVAGAASNGTPSARTPAAPPASRGYVAKDAREVVTAAVSTAPMTTSELSPFSLQVATDRWLLFKRPQPEEPTPEKTTSPGSDLVKGIVTKHVLGGKLPL